MPPIIPLLRDDTYARFGCVCVSTHVHTLRVCVFMILMTPHALWLHLYVCCDIHTVVAVTGGLPLFTDNFCLHFV